MGLFVIMFEKTRESRLGLALFSFPVGWCAFGLVLPEAPRHAKKVMMLDSLGWHNVGH
jgi:hypothetical protein